MYESAFHPKLYSLEKDSSSNPQKGQRTSCTDSARTPRPGKNETRNAYQVLLVEADHLFNRHQNRSLKLLTVPRADVITAQHQTSRLRSPRANKTVPASHTTAQVHFFQPLHRKGDVSEEVKQYGG
jgi:hypothetical protein